jgi:hypothetical protein
MSMSNHSGYTNVCPRGPGRWSHGTRVAWSTVRKYRRVWRTHVRESLLVERVAAMGLSFLPRMAPSCHNLLCS